MGFSIADISAMLNGRSTAEILEQRKTELESEAQKVTDQLFRLKFYIKEQKEGQKMDCQAVIKEIPAITAVCVLHRGAYEKIGAAYAYAVKWAEENGYRITDNVRESYIDGIWNKESVDDWLTEIQVPVEKK